MYGQAVTATALSPVPPGTVASGTVVPLIATVSDASGPVLSGQLTFSDGAKMVGAVRWFDGERNEVPGHCNAEEDFWPGWPYSSGGL